MKRVFLLIFLFIIIQGIYQGVTSPARELDSVMYHIPIAKAYLTGDIFSTPKSPILHRYFPGASEGILALFLLAHIPLNLYNVMAMICLSFVLFFLGQKAGLSRDLSFIFAIGFASLTAVTRWFDTQVVDIWLAVYYAWALGLLLKPQKKLIYFLQLGTTVGMLVGTKYSGPFFLIILFLMYGKGIIKSISVKQILGFVIPFGILGMFWYVRNFWIMGNPFYPLGFLSFPGVKNWALEEPVWSAIAHNPSSMMSAFISEYLGWSLVLFIAPFYLIFVFVKKKFDTISIFIILGLLNVFVYLFLPNGQSYTVHVSNLRYVMPVMIPLVLAAFLYAQKIKQEEFISMMAFAGIMFSLQFAYHPKLIFVYLSIVLFSVVFYLKKVL